MEPLTRETIVKKIEKGESLSGLNLAQADLSYSSLKNGDFSGADLSGAHLHNANLEGANLQGANLENAFLFGSNLKDVNFEGASLVGTNLQDTNLEGANLKGTDLSGLSLFGAQLDGANLEGAILKKAKLREGKSKDQGIEGENPSVTRIREGLEHTYGGIVKFEAGRARILDAYREELDQFVEKIQGLNSRIRIRGHATAKPKSDYAPFPTLEDLSYARARAVRQYLTESGIRPERMTVEACGSNEPVRVQAYDDESRLANRRVSIIVTETLVPDFRGKPRDEAEDTIR